MTTQAQHEANAQLARTVHALLTAEVSGLDEHADDIIRHAVDGSYAAGMLVILGLEAAGLAHELADARGVSVSELLAERGLQIASL